MLVRSCLAGRAAVGRLPCRTGPGDGRMVMAAPRRGRVPALMCGRCLYSSKATTEWAAPGSVYDMLHQRGYISQTVGQYSSKADFDRLLSAHPDLGVYAGVDPTASSLHIGHLLPFMVLIRFWLLGRPVVALVGSGTARIGDPTGRTDSRVPMTRQQTDSNSAALRDQLRRLFENAETIVRNLDDGTEPGKGSGLLGEDGPGSLEVVENHKWMDEMSVLDALSELGPAFRLGRMLGRDTVKTRLENGSGMALSEFLYPFLQALDWVRLFYTRGTGVQVGGSDQFGNILAGADAIKYVATLPAHTHGNGIGKCREGSCPVSADSLDQPLGLTVPLLTAASGQKFGKSAGNAVWLDDRLTSPFELYAYFMATPDHQLESLFRMFTFLSLQDIQTLLIAASEGTGLEARHRLASEVVGLVHGPNVANQTGLQHRALLGGSHKHLTVDILLQFVKSSSPSLIPDPKSGSDRLSDKLRNQTVVEISESVISTVPAFKLLQLIGLTASGSEASKLIKSGGAYIAVPSHLETCGENVHLQDPIPVRFDSLTSATDPIAHRAFLWNRNEDRKVVVVRTGKKNIRVISVRSGE